MAAINQRFILGHAAGTLSAAGVLVHQFDRYTTGLGRQPWALEPEVNHVSCSLINLRVPYTYSPSAAGLVLSPSHTRVKCVYATDGGTHGTPDGCGRRARCTARKWWMCKYPPARLAEMLEAHERRNCRGWNEVVVSRADWERAVPRGLEAIFFVRGTPQGSARRLRAAFARRYGRELPLLSFDPRNRTLPFRRVRAGNRTEAYPSGNAGLERLHRLQNAYRVVRAAGVRVGRGPFD